MKIENVVKELKGGEQLVYNKSCDWVAIVYNDGDTQKTRRVFKIKEAGEVEEIPFKKARKQLVKSIMDRINNDDLVKLILTETIDTTRPDELFDLIERVIECKGEVEQRPGCVELEIAGKRGKHMHFRLM